MLPITSTDRIHLGVARHNRELQPRAPYSQVSSTLTSCRSRWRQAVSIGAIAPEFAVISAPWIQPVRDRSVSARSFGRTPQPRLVRAGRVFAGVATWQHSGGPQPTVSVVARTVATTRRQRRWGSGPKRARGKRGNIDRLFDCGHTLLCASVGQEARQADFGRRSPSRGANRRRPDRRAAGGGR